MSLKLKLGGGKFALALAGVNLGLFLLYFVPYYVMEGKGITQGYEYFRMYTEEIVFWLLPLISAIFLTARYVEGGIKGVLRDAAIIALSNAVYTVPFYYLLGIAYSIGDSIMAILWALGVSLIYILLFFGRALLLFFIIKLTLERFVPSEEMRVEKFISGSTMDLSAPSTLAIFFAALAEFIIHLATEIYDAISYLTNYVGDYRGEDLAYMMFRFIFILGMLFASQAICVKMKNVIIEKPDEE